MRQKQYKNYLIGSLSCALVAFILSIVFLQSTTKRDLLSKKIALDEAHALWQKDKRSDQNQQILAQASTEAEQYGRFLAPKVAQDYLLLSMNEVARPFVQTTSCFLITYAPDYAEFSNISSLIAGKKWEQALTASYQLQERIDPAIKPVLASLNQLRISELQKICPIAKRNPSADTPFFTQNNKALVLLTKIFRKDGVDLRSYLEENYPDS